MKLWILGVAMFFFAGHVLADEWPAYPQPDDDAKIPQWEQLIKLRPSYQKCLDDAAGVVPSNLECKSVEYSYQDKRLNQVYRRLMSALDEDKKDQLRTEERRWIAYRDSSCNDDLPQTVPEGCKVVATADRATQLESRLRK